MYSGDIEVGGTKTYRDTRNPKKRVRIVGADRSLGLVWTESVSAGHRGGEFREDEFFDRFELETPPAPIRSIRLNLAKNTTATECGECPKGDGYFCRQFDLPRSNEVTTRLVWHRSKMCIAAEAS